MAPSGKDGFDVVPHRRKKVELIPCPAPGCTGKCPRNVIEQGLRGLGYTPAKCFECGRQYRKLPGGAPTARDSGRPGVDQSASAKRVQALEQEVKKLRQQVQAPEVKAKIDASGEAAAPEDPAAVEAKAIQNRISAIKGLPEDQRDFFCAGMGGYKTALAKLEDDLQQAWARKRSGLPIERQKASAEAYLKRRQKVRDDAAEELAALAEQQRELQGKVDKQQALLDEAEALLLKAKDEAVAVAERATAALRGGGYEQACALTATTVKSFFATLPVEVAAQVEGQAVIKQVMELLERLDTAARTAQAAGEGAGSSASEPAAQPQQARPPAPAGVDEEMDSDELDAIADAAVPPVQGDDDAASRKARVAEARARIQATKKDFLKRKAK